MADEPKDPTTVFAEELAKQLPVKAAYRDAVKPSAKQIGQLAQDIVKTIQLALAPLQFVGAYQDRLRAFIDRSVRNVPEANRVSPAPQILGTVVEGIRYEPVGKYRSGGGRLVRFGVSSEDLTLSLALRSCGECR